MSTCERNGTRGHGMLYLSLVPGPPHKDGGEHSPIGTQHVEPDGEDSEADSWEDESRCCGGSYGGDTRD